MWDKRYSGSDFAYGTDPNDFLKENAHYFAGGDILSLAEGEGRNAVFLAKEATSVTAVDSSSVGLKKAEQLAKTRGVSITTTVADLADFTPDKESYDGIVSIFCHLPKKLQQELHQKCIAALKPGGIFLLEGYTEGQIELGTGGPKNALFMYSLAELRQEFSECEELYGVELTRNLYEGILHSGESAVVQFIVRKRR